MSPSKRRAAAAIVAAWSPFHQPRPIFSTLMRQRGGQLRLALANPRVPLAPDATSHHRAFAVYPASHRPQCEQLSACTRPVLYAIEKAACVTVIFCLLHRRSVRGRTMSEKSAEYLVRRLVSKLSYSRTLGPSYTAPANRCHASSAVKASPSPIRVGICC